MWQNNTSEQDISYLRTAPLFPPLPTTPFPTTMQAVPQQPLYLRPLVSTREQLVHLIDRYIALFCLLLFFAAVFLLDFTLFQGALLTLILTEGACLVVFSSVLARWACWYVQLHPHTDPGKPTTPLVHQTQSSRRKFDQFGLLQADTMNYLRSIRIRKGSR